MASERHDGDRQDSAAGLRYLLKYSHRKCTLCGFVMKDDGEWPECPYDKGHMKPYAPEYRNLPWTGFSYGFVLGLVVMLAVTTLARPA